MSNLLKRTAVAIGLTLTAVALTGKPASAATTDNINASVANNGTVTVPSSTNVALGDTVTLTNTAGSNGPVTAYANNTCGGGGVASYGPVPVPGSVTLGTFDTPSYQVGNTVHFSINAGLGAVCTPFDLVIVAATPPPDVAETPYVAGLLGAAGVVFGIGFLMMRRRHNRIVSTKSAAS
jgi:plastocyanin